MVIIKGAPSLHEEILVWKLNICPVVTGVTDKRSRIRNKKSKSDGSERLAKWRQDRQKRQRKKQLGRHERIEKEYSEKDIGFGAGSLAKVNIHLPSQHNTSHDNVGGDREQEDGGSIANINADGTFTHIVVEEEEDDY